jgi:DnaJ-class molecular chaperone
MSPLPDRQTWVECDECSGRGSFYRTITVSGEGFDADQDEIECEACSGQGGWERLPDFAGEGEI